jgi:hypothetical protein
MKVICTFQQSSGFLLNVVQDTQTQKLWNKEKTVNILLLQQHFT